MKLLEDRISQIPDDKLLVADEVALIFDVHPTTVRKWVNEGWLEVELTIPFLKFSKRDLEKFRKEYANVQLPDSTSLDCSNWIDLHCYLFSN